MQYKIHKY